ncbi:hypothetical protein EZS27_032816, partial [termite gut metagenome]
MGWFFGFKLHLLCNERGELVDFCLTRGNVDDRNQKIFSVLSKYLFGKLYADKGYISASLFDTNPLSNSGFNPIEKRDRFQSIFIKLAYYFNQPAFYLPQAV